MNSKNGDNNMTTTGERKLAHHVMQRLDQSLPLYTEEWERVEQLLNRLTEFAPTELISEMMASVVLYADDQARRGYVLGQDDLIKALRQRAA